MKTEIDKLFEKIEISLEPVVVSCDLMNRLVEEDYPSYRYRYSDLDEIIKQRCNYAGIKYGMDYYNHSIHFVGRNAHYVMGLKTSITNQSTIIGKLNLELVKRQVSYFIIFYTIIFSYLLYYFLK